MTDLTRAERVSIERRRSGLSARDFARAAGVGFVTLWTWETGRRDPPDWAVPSPSEIGDLTPQERCWVARRRAGMTTREAGVRLGLSATTISMMERGLRSPRRLAALLGVDLDDGTQNPDDDRRTTT